VVAVALLGVGAYFLFFNEPEKPTSTIPTPPPVARTAPQPVENTAAATPSGTTPTPTNSADSGKPPAPANTAVNTANAPLPPGLPTNIPNGDITNLLPGDAQAVYAIHVERFRACTLGQQMFESRVGFKPEAFKQRLGIDIAEINRFVRAESLEG